MLIKNLLTKGSNFREVLLILALIISFCLTINIHESFAEAQTKSLAINIDEIE